MSRSPKKNMLDTVCLDFGLMLIMAGYVPESRRSRYLLCHLRKQAPNVDPPVVTSRAMSRNKTAVDADEELRMTTQLSRPSG